MRSGAAVVRCAMDPTANDSSPAALRMRPSPPSSLVRKHLGSTTAAPSVALAEPAPALRRGPDGGAEGCRTPLRRAVCMVPCYTTVTVRMALEWWWCGRVRIHAHARTRMGILRTAARCRSERCCVLHRTVQSHSERSPLSTAAGNLRGGRFARRPGSATNWWAEAHPTR